MQHFYELTAEERCKLMVLLRGPFGQKEMAGLINVKPVTVYGWERSGKLPRLEHLRALLGHFSRWYVDDALPGTFAKAMAEITHKKHLTRLKPHASKGSHPNPSAEKEA